jgi:hypothetical protein
VGTKEVGREPKEGEAVSYRGLKKCLGREQSEARPWAKRCLQNRYNNLSISPLGYAKLQKIKALRNKRT